MIIQTFWALNFGYADVVAESWKKCKKCLSIKVLETEDKATKCKFLIYYLSIVMAATSMMSYMNVDDILPVFYPHPLGGCLAPSKTSSPPGRPFTCTPPSRVHHAGIEYFYVSSVYRQYMKFISTSYLTSDSDITVVRRMNIVFCSHMPVVFFFSNIFHADYLTVIV